MPLKPRFHSSSSTENLKRDSLMCSRLTYPKVHISPGASWRDVRGRCHGNRWQRWHLTSPKASFANQRSSGGHMPQPRKKKRDMLLLECT